jgi:glycosyltransferase involved in cell wall biosynthesis
MAIQSVLRQDYPLAKVEIVVVDDGSTNADAVMYIEKLREDFENHDWQVLRTEKK